jgi:hypothetical protein
MRVLAVRAARKLAGYRRSDDEVIGYDENGLPQ